MDSNSQLLCPKGKPQPTLIRVRQRRQPQAPAHGCPQLAIPRTSAAPVRSTSLPSRARDLEVVCACWADIIIMYARMANPENSPVRDISFPTNTAAILRTTPAKQRRLMSEHSLRGRTYLTTTPLGTQVFARRSTMLSVPGPTRKSFRRSPWRARHQILIPCCGEPEQDGIRLDEPRNTRGPSGRGALGRNKIWRKMDASGFSFGIQRSREDGDRTRLLGTCFLRDESQRKAVAASGMGCIFCRWDCQINGGLACWDRDCLWGQQTWRRPILSRNY